MGIRARWYKHRMPGELAASEPRLRASLRRGGVLAAAMLLALTWTASSAQAVPAWLAPQTTSDPTAAPVGIEPAMTMGPGGDIAAASWTEGGEIVADVRPAGAASFTHEAVSTPADAAALPSVAVNAAGVVAVAWFDATAEQYEVAIRPPGGTFSTPIDAGPTGGATPQASSVAIDDAGDVLVGETREAVGGDVAVYAWIPAGGAFTATTVSEPEGEASRPVVAMNGAGDAIVAWDDKGSGPRDIARAVTRPAGGPFGSTQSLTDSSEYAFAITAAIGSGGQPAVAWQRGLTKPPYRIEASTSAGPADLLSAPQTISPAGGNAESPAIAVAGNGEVVAAWEQLGATDTEDAASAIAGSGFGLPAAASAGGSVGDPQVATDGAGDAVIAWGSTAGGLESVAAVTRTAAGVVGPEVTLSAPGEKVDYFFTHGTPAALVGMDRAGDALVGWEHAADHTAQVRIYDATGPTLTPSIPTSATVGAPVSFSAAAGDLFSAVTSTVWSFGDGATGAGSALAHTYAKPGTYTVTVTATDAVGNVTTASGQITVIPALVACPVSATPVGDCPPIGGCPGACPLPLRCIVPHLQGLSRSAAKRRLRAAYCRLAKVSVAKRYRHAKRLVVSSQSVKAGSRIASGASVAVTLKPARPRRRGKHRR
jgi:hypothetical protein